MTLDDWTPIQLYRERGAYFAVVARHAWRPGQWTWNCSLTEARHQNLGMRARGQSKTLEEACRRADENLVALNIEKLEWDSREEPLPGRLLLDVLAKIVELRKTASPEEARKLDEQRDRFLKRQELGGGRKKKGRAK